MIPPDVHAEIMSRLRRVEHEEGVRIVLAVESGSRAWGFASPNSDFDVRFIYVRPREWYLSLDLEDQRDVIEHEIVDDIDLNGWDLRKALRLLWKSNPGIVEWIQSPFRYMESGGFASGTLGLLPHVYLPESGLHHYRSAAKSTYLTHFKTPSVSLKKYFYVLRPLLAARWIERHGAAAPIEFHKLMTMIDDGSALTAAIHDLLDAKRQAPELGTAAPVPEINAFIESELERLGMMYLQRTHRLDALERLNALFHETLNEHASDT